MKTTTVGEFCPFTYGKALSKSNREIGNVPVYGSNGRVGYHNQNYITKPGIIIGRKGSVAALHISKDPFWPIDTSFYVTKSNFYELVYTFYLLKTLGLEKMNSDSAVPGLNRANAHALEIKILETESDRVSVAKLIGLLDDKIEVNQKMNQTLENIAKATFKSWFVDFDPVRAKAEGRPTGLPSDISDLFPDELVDSELGKIPKGWSSKLLGNILTPKRGKTITKKDCGDGSIPVVAGGLEPAYFHDQSNVEAPVVTVSASGANAGYVKLHHQDIWASDCSYISYRETPTPLLWYIFLKLNQREIFHMQHGAAQPHIQPSDLRRLPVVFPNNEILWEALNELLIPVFSRIGIGLQENKILSQIRDTLLPKLISGQIRVPDAEKFLEETAI